ncbi:MAG: relaxase domain-containing protein [Actinomycetota bacterium]|nr:relaxase domain-containing protein [Actinomycetota bacterium]
MLNIGRMAPGSDDYYLSVVAAGVEDYYLARGEAPGRWLGREVEAFGLEGRVEGDPLRRVLAGADPNTGVRLAAHPARKVPGFDLTFRAPKSVSLMWALSDGGTAAEVCEAHDAAVDAAMGFIERAAARTRRGAGGTERVEVDGLIAAAFRHRTSRAGDPLLHTHVLVANLARASDDGVWRTLESRRLFLFAKTAGYLYQAHLRHELTSRLGVAWQPVTNGYADLAEVPRWLIDAFSRRRQAILQRLDEVGETSARAAQVATLETRPVKEGRASEAELRRAWAARADLLGFDRVELDRLLHRHVARGPGIAALIDELVSREGLTEQSSTFARRDVLQAVAERLPDGAPVQHVEELADAVLERGRDDLVALGARRERLAVLGSAAPDRASAGIAADDETRLTTRGLLLLEQQAINSTLDRRYEGVAVVPGALLEAAIATCGSLSDEQATVVRQLTSSGHGVEVLVGKAGTGKTFALAAARDAWQRAGIPVTGAALAARAAIELQDATGIPVTTLARLLRQVEDGRPGSPLAPRSVLVVDEAGMVGTRHLARLLRHAESQQVKVVLVGDAHQLPEIDAGGLFRALTTRLPAVELTHNRRQTQPWEVAALDQLRHGDPNQAITAYQAHGRIITADTTEALREQLVADWWDTYDQLGATSAVMVALRRSDVDDLNTRARTRLLAAGHLTGPTLHLDGQRFQAGDRIVCLRNDRRIGVVNGTPATITTVDPGHRALDVTTDDGRRVSLPARYLEAGHVAHGYAITGHKAQGLTMDHIFVLGSPELYREWGYVALSRGRHTNRLYVCPGVGDDELHQHAPEPPVDQITSVAGRLRRSRAQQPVSDEIFEQDAQWRQLHARLHAPDIARRQRLAERRGALLEDRERIHDRLAAIVQQLDRQHGSLARWRNRHERARLEGDHETRSAWLDSIDTQLRQVDAELASLPTEHEIADLRDQYRRLTTNLSWTASRRVAGFARDCPAYLTTTLGIPPPQRRDGWDKAAFAVEQYRLRWGVTEPDRPLGPEPADPLQREEHRWAAMAIEQHRRELDRELKRGPNRELDIPLSR